MNSAPWWVALAVPALSGLIAWGVAWYTNRRVDQREHKDRDERERARTADRQADLSRALLPARIDAHREFVRAVMTSMRGVEVYLHARKKGDALRLVDDPHDLAMVHQENVHILAALFDLEVAALAKSVQDNLSVLREVARRADDPTAEDLARWEVVRKAFAGYLTRVGRILAGETSDVSQVSPTP